MHLHTILYQFGLHKVRQSGSSGQARPDPPNAAFLSCLRPQFLVPYPLRLSVLRYLIYKVPIPSHLLITQLFLHTTTSPTVQTSTSTIHLPTVQWHQYYWQISTLPTIPQQSVTVSPPRTTTYYYNPKTNELLTREAYDYPTVAAAPSLASPPTPSLSYCSTAPTTPTTSPRTPTAKMVRTRAVNFGTVEGAREPFHDERYVFKLFNSHVKRCDECYDSLHSGHSDLPMCSDGYGLYVDMGPYFYCSGGKPYSSVEREKYGEKNRVLVPHEMTHVQALFQQLDRGYAPKASRHASRPKVVIVQPESPVKSSTKSPKTVHFSRYDDSDVVIVPADRRRHRDRERYYEERRQQTNTEKPYVVQREPRRGSLYYEDEQRRHRHGERVVLVPADQVYYRS